MAKTRVRKGMPSSALTKAEFTRRARERFVDPAFEGLQAEIDRIIDAAWVAVHGVMIVTPVSWYQAPSGLKAVMDRLVCADGGNPDPTTTQGKDSAMAKEIELQTDPGGSPQRRTFTGASRAPDAKRQARATRCPPGRRSSKMRNRCPL